MPYVSASYSGKNKPGVLAKASTAKRRPVFGAANFADPRVAKSGAGAAKRTALKKAKCSPAFKEPAASVGVQKSKPKKPVKRVRIAKRR